MEDFQLFDTLVQTYQCGRNHSFREESQWTVDTVVPLNCNEIVFFLSSISNFEENVFGVLFELCVVLKQTNSKCASTYVEQS